MTDHTDLIAELREEAAEMRIHDIACDTSERAADALKAAQKHIEALEAQLAEAERRGAEQMRERAARTAADFIHERLYKPDFPACSYHSRSVFDDIRALPLTEGRE